MEGSGKIFCRLCFNNVNNEDFIVIDQSTRKMLKTISPNLDLVNNQPNIMCSTCSVKLYLAFDFKSTCLYVEDRITSYVNPKVSFVDLREVYLQEQDNKTVKMDDDQRICRLCLQLVREGFMSFHEMKLEIINKYISEVNFGLTDGPVICKQCFESLSIHGTFIRTCLDGEMETCNIDDKYLDFETCGIFVKRENDEIKLKDEQRNEGTVKIEKEPEIDKTIESEEIDIKFEREEWESDSISIDLHNEVNDNKMGSISEEIGGLVNEYMHNYETENVRKHKGLIDIALYKSDYKYELNNHGKHETVQNSIYHHLITKNSSLAQLYICDACGYRTKYKGQLKAHQLVHKNPSDIQMYKCEMCDFKTKFRQNLKLHLLVHKNSSEIQMYKCHTCTYETKYKNCLKIHQLTHKDKKEIRMYKCDTCTFKTKYKHSLKYHQLTHKDPSEIEMYKCGQCGFETIYKGNLKTHQLAHENPSTARKKEYSARNSSAVDPCHPSVCKQVFKCNECDFETTVKYTLKVHLLKHQDPSRIQMYKCDKCRFQTRHKSSLTRHQLVHKNS